jgi:hypothetical protein
MSSAEELLFCVSYTCPPTAGSQGATSEAHAFNSGNLDYFLLRKLNPTPNLV